MIPLGYINGRKRIERLGPYRSLENLQSADPQDHEEVPVLRWGYDALKQDTRHIRQRSHIAGCVQYRCGGQKA